MGLGLNAYGFFQQFNNRRYQLRVHAMNYIEKLKHYLKLLSFTLFSAMLFLPVAGSFAYEQNAAGAVAIGATDDQTELVKAAFSGKEKTVKELLDKGVSPDLQNEKGFTPLMVASQYGHLDIVERRSS